MIIFPFEDSVSCACELETNPTDSANARQNLKIFFMMENGLNNLYRLRHIGET